MQPPTSIHCSPSTAVIQILPHLQCGQMAINSRTAQKIAAYVVLPNTGGTTISCPINYFQESASLPGKWIRDDSGKKIHLNSLGSISRFLLTISSASTESICRIAASYESRIYEYFMLDISHNESCFTGFDCYAFVSFLANAAYCPTSPPFDYSSVGPNAGDIVAISDGAGLPDSIKHWALCIGNDKYLSKFGSTGMGAQSLVEAMDLGGMKRLYSCSHCFVASLQNNASPWTGM